VLGIERADPCAVALGEQFDELGVDLLDLGFHVGERRRRKRDRQHRDQSQFAHVKTPLVASGSLQSFTCRDRKLWAKCEGVSTRGNHKIASCETRAGMKGKIGLEEHFAIPETLADSRGFFPDAVWTEVKERLLDLHSRRLRLMDEHGIEMMLLSINAPVVQAIPDAAQANELSRKANDYLAE